MKQIPLHASNGNRPVVLIVDDNSAIRNMVSWALELDGIEPAEAMDGKAALEWLQNAAREGRIPSVILLDLAMPGMDGAAFLQSVRDLWRAYFPPVIVITANAEVADAKTLGVAHVIVKPFHVRDLLAVVRKLL
jgi:DNA-binding response OmpR family regulator